MRGTLLAVSVIFGVALCSGAQRSQEQPSITYGTAKVSLGMTVNQVQQNLAGTSRHMRTLPDFKESPMVYVNGQSDTEGQIIFGDGRVVTYADFKMPAANTAEELAQEIQGAWTIWKPRLVICRTTPHTEQVEKYPRAFLTAAQEDLLYRRSTRLASARERPTLKSRLAIPENRNREGMRDFFWHYESEMQRICRSARARASAPDSKSAAIRHQSQRSL